VKKGSLALIALCLAIGLIAASCNSLADAAIGSLTGAVTGKAVSSAESTMAEFKNGEYLCALGNAADEPRFRVATILTPASDTTKNQAEVLYVDNGEKAWANLVIDSRKVTKADIKKGVQVFFIGGWSGSGDADPNSYRKDGWYLGNVTNDDELFKDIVEVGGDKYSIKNLRIATSPLK
jgi:hypothetical protein